jgi:hypothetical protein
MKRYLYGCVVLCGILAGCQSELQWGDIGEANDMTNRQEQMRANQAIPGPTQMPPGLGEDLPMPDQAAPPAAQPVSLEK